MDHVTELVVWVVGGRYVVMGRLEGTIDLNYWDHFKLNTEIANYRHYIKGLKVQTTT